MRTESKNSMGILRLLLGVGILLGYFNSCDVYSENNLFAELESRCVDSNECVYQSSEYMELKINTENNYPIASTDQAFEVSGDCNEGGFAQNMILWEIYLDGNRVFSSDSGGTGVCVLGHFSARVTLPNQGLFDNSNPPVRREHRLDVELVGLDEHGETYRNPLMARKSITLTPQ